MMKSQMITASIITAAVMVALAGCDDASDSGESDGQQVQLSGTVVDGYVAGARVWLDVNDNYQIDSFEPIARTDRYGFFSYRPKLVDEECDVIAEERDYCDSSKPYYDGGRYCLDLADTTEPGNLRMVGGWDLLADEPFKGAMSRKIEVIPGKGGSDLVVSPLTSLIVGESDEIEHVDDRGEDFWGDSGKCDNGYVWQRKADRDKLADALRLHKVAEILTEGILHELAGVDENLIEDIFGLSPSMMVYRKLRAQMDDVVLNSPNDIPDLNKGKINEALDKIKDKLAKEDINLNNSDLSGVASGVHEQIANLFDENAQSGSDEPRSRADARSVETATGLALETIRDNDNGTSNASAGTSANGNVSASEIRKAIGDDEGDNLDIGSLVQRLKSLNDNSDNDISDKIEDAVKNSRVEADLPEIAGTKLRLTVIDDDGDNAEMVFYFAPAKGEDVPTDDDNGDSLAGWHHDEGYADEGKLTACLAFPEGIDFPLEEDDIEDGFTGTWERLSDRSLLLNVRFADEPQTLNMRVRASSNAASLGQYYDRHFWSDEEGRGDFWRDFSYAYWSGEVNNKDEFLGDTDEGRFYVFGDEESGEGREGNWDDKSLTPRGWVFDLLYEGDRERWDVEQTRDRLIAADGEVEIEERLQLFVPFDGDPEC
ncbi:hypothetical protein [Halorhodospira halochloris]|uniref:hypothetical protein n=1 Tax=Halorhodospira halochloris TaxID=1052 RepID=UPI001EE96B90|nr:hypothetical protein [Halorhodospira halochloris]MCG5547598.1 hypothetical protein [Halorhodospira halochloris]